MKRIASDFDRFKRDGVAFVKECNRKIERKKAEHADGMLCKGGTPGGNRTHNGPLGEHFFLQFSFQKAKFIAKMLLKLLLNGSFKVFFKIIFRLRNIVY